MAINYGVKALAIFSAFFGLMTLIVCFWTFGSMIVFHAHVEMRRGNSTKVISPDSNPEITHLWARMSTVSRRFRLVMYCCLWISIVFLLAQIISSLIIFFRKDTKPWIISKHFVGIHFAVFIALLCCLLVPLAEDRKRDLQHSFTTFNDYIMQEFESFSAKGIKYIVQDFHAYYFVLGSNIAIIFFSMIIACCLLRCETNQPYESV